MEISKLSKIYKNVMIGKNVTIEEFCVIGKPPSGKSDGELETIIGENSIIRSGTVIYSGNKIGNDFNTGHNVVIRENNQIGQNVSIGTLSCIEHSIIIEDYVRIHSQVFIPEFTTIRKNAWIGPKVCITNAKYPKSKTAKNSLMGAYIDENAKLGANVTTLPGVKIGKNALVGSGALVNKDIFQEEVVIGNPIKRVKNIKEIKEYND